MDEFLREVRAEPSGVLLIAFNVLGLVLVVWLLLIA